jgi:hypothetical protein
MKRTAVVFLVVTLFCFCVGGCATYIPAGALYTGGKAGVAVADGDLNCSKVGTAESNSLFALVTWGDSSIQTAAKNGGISKVKYVDYEVQNILGIFGKYTTIVHGD